MSTTKNPLELYRNVTGKSKSEYSDYLWDIDKLNWHNYDYKTWPCADLSFPDLDQDQHHDLWPFKPDINKVHWVCLNNQFKSGILRRGFIDGYEVPEQLNNDRSFEEVHDVVKKLLALKDNDPVTFQNELSSYKIKDESHLLWLKAHIDNTLEKSYDETNAFLKEKQDESNAVMNQNIEAAKSGGLLDPIDGIDMETWAAANAKIAGGMDFEEILKVVGTEKPIWDKVSAEWNARMTQDTTFAIAKVYGDAFTNPNMGKFADNNVPQVANDNSAIEKVKEDFELYIKIMCHQSMAATQGKDANAILEEYGLNGADWGAIGMHWSPKMQDVKMAMKMSDLMDKYNAEFATTRLGDDIEF